MERDLGTKMNFRCDEKCFLIFNVYLRCINIKKTRTNASSTLEWLLNFVSRLQMRLFSPRPPWRSPLGLTEFTPALLVPVNGRACFFTLTSGWSSFSWYCCEISQLVGFVLVWHSLMISCERIYNHEEEPRRTWAGTKMPCIRLTPVLIWTPLCFSLQRTQSRHYQSLSWLQRVVWNDG